MADLFENPAGLDGFEFIEFSAPERGILEPIFEKMGFERVAKHRSKDVDLWRQGTLRVNMARARAAWVSVLRTSTQPMTICSHRAGSP